MDLYEIFVTHNRPWSMREIICFVILFIFAAIVGCALLIKKKIVISQLLSGLLLVVFLAIVFASTLFTRRPGGEHRYELELFWSWRAVAAGSKEMLQENLLNIILLSPVGILLPFVFRRRLRWWQGLLLGTAVSVVIEVSQLIFRRGLFEWDDIIHNGIGCMAGCILIGNVVFGRRRK